MKDLNLPGFRLLGELGRGGSAKVFLAEKAGGQRYALKVFHSGNTDQADFRRRILGEWKAAAAPEEVGLVRIHDLLEVSGLSILVMDYVEGASLAEFQSRLPYVLPEVSVLLAAEVLRTLEAVHGRGIVHRDIKPSNVLVENSGRVLLTDFGLAKWNDASAHTLHGAILGSPDFMSPEQAQGDIVTPQSDLFSLASVLYFLVTGTKPFARSSPLATLAAVVKGEYEPAGRRNPKISPALSRILQKGMAPLPRDRFASATEFRVALEEYLAKVGFPSSLTLAIWKARAAEGTMEALQAIAEKLAANGRAEVDKGLRDQATETISHLSLVAPDSLALQELLDRLQTSGKRGAFIWRAAALVVIFGAIFWGLNNTEWFSPAVAVAPTPVTPPSAPIVEIPVPEIVAEPEVKARTPAPISAPKKEKTALMQKIRFNVPEGVEVEWNGIAVPLDRPFFAKPGVHDITFRKEGFQPISRQIEVVAGEPTVIRVN